MGGERLGHGDVAYTHRPRTSQCGALAQSDRRTYAVGGNGHGSDIHAAHRSPDERLLVTSDEFRKINLFRYPCGPGSAACRSVIAHASRVPAVRFTSDGRYVISIGGPDLSLAIWSVRRPD